MMGQCQTCDITSCQYRCSSESADAETFGTAVTLRLLLSFSFTTRAAAPEHNTGAAGEIDLFTLQTLKCVFLLVLLLLLTMSLWLIGQSAGTFRTTTRFGLVPGSCFHPYSVRLSKSPYLGKTNTLKVYFSSAHLQKIQTAPSKEINKELYSSSSTENPLKNCFVLWMLYIWWITLICCLTLNTDFYPPNCGVLLIWKFHQRAASVFILCILCLICYQRLIFVYPLSVPAAHLTILVGGFLSLTLCNPQSFSCVFLRWVKGRGCCVHLLLLFSYGKPHCLNDEGTVEPFKTNNY